LAIARQILARQKNQAVLIKQFLQRESQARGSTTPAKHLVFRAKRTVMKTDHVLPMNEYPHSEKR
jgi:hypothetical protein